MDDAYIKIRQLTKLYPMGREVVRALAGIDLDIPRKSMTVIMGPSGSGKSTLLYLLGGLDRPTSGTIQVDGLSVETMDENLLAEYRRNRIGFVFQSFNLVSSMSTRENVEFPMRFAGVNDRQRKERAVAMLRDVGLENWQRHKPTELSGGQQQRAAIARALINNPDVILADEPTGNLDSSTGFTIMELLSELHQQGRTVVVVSHDPRMLRFASHSVYLLDGLSVSPEEYEAATATSFKL